MTLQDYKRLCQENSIGKFLWNYRTSCLSPLSQWQVGEESFFFNAIVLRANNDSKQSETRSGEVSSTNSNIHVRSNQEFNRSTNQKLICREIGFKPRCPANQPKGDWVASSPLI